MSIRQRYYTRHQISLDVSVRGQNGWVHYRTVDVSRRGVFLRSDNPSPLNRLVQMRVELPTGVVLDVMGRVRRSLQSRVEGPIGPGMGIEFFVMSQEQQDDWDAFVLAQPRGESGHLRSDSGMVYPDASADHLDLPDSPRGAAETAPGATVMGIPRDDARHAVAAAVEKATRADGVGAGVRHHPPPGTDLADREVTASATKGAAAAQRTSARRTPSAPAAAEGDAGNGGAVHVNVRPETREHLDQFVVRRVSGRKIFLRVDVDVSPGQPVRIVLVHPDTDCELQMEASVLKALPAAEGHGSGMLVAFAEAEGKERGRLRRFVELGSVGVPDAEKTEESKHEALLAAALAAPDSAAAQNDVGWSYIARRTDPELAVESFLAALAADGDSIAAHRGLSLAYALVGDVHRAYAFASSWRQLEQRREAAEAS